MTGTTIQIQPCMDIHEGVVSCPESKADYFGVYVGNPGDYQWVADFREYLDAKEFAAALVASCRVDDLVQHERDMK